MRRPDWAAATDRIFEGSVAAFRAFATARLGSRCSHVIYHCDPHNGHVLLGFDTPENGMRVARLHQEERLGHVRDLFVTAPWNREDAHGVLKTSRIGPVNLTSDRIAFPEEVIWRFPEWQEFADDEQYPQPRHAGDFDGDYLNANVAMCLWDVVERLEAGRAFDVLPTGPPCVVSYELHGDGTPVVLRVLNWPAGDARAHGR